MSRYQSGYGNVARRGQRSGSRRRLLLMFVLLLCAGLATFWYFKPQTRPGWVAEHMPTAAGATVTVYRWQDDNGQWIVSDQVPSDRDFETLEYRHDANALPFNPTPENDN